MKGKRPVSALLAVMMFFMSSGASALPAPVLALGDVNDEAAEFTLGTSLNDVVSVDEANFPDSTFRSYVSENFDTDNSGELSSAEIAEATVINVNVSNIADLSGIEYFTALTDLSCDNNQLTSLDVSKNTSLKKLYCNDNQLTSLDLSKHPALTELNCSYNHLISLDISSTALTLFECDHNFYSIGEVEDSYPLSSLPAGFDPAKASEWRGAEYDAETNSLKKFTSESVSYTYDCSNGKTAEFVLVRKLPTVEINEENFPDEAFRKIISESFDTDGDGELSQEEIVKVTEINVNVGNIADLSGIEYFTALTHLSCNGNQLTSLDLSKNTALKVLYCSNNQLTSLNVSNNTALKMLYCSENQLTSLDLSDKTNLECLSCENNQFTSLNVSNNTALKELYCYKNQLTILNVSNNTALTKLYCHPNQLTSLDVSNNTALTELNCSVNQLTSLDVSNNPALTELYCKSSSFDIGDVKGRYSLSKLPIGFVASKASNWNGATYDKDTNSLINFTSDTVTYDYDCGNGHSITFTLNCTFVTISNITVASDKVVITYSDNSTLSYAFDEVSEEMVDHMVKTDIKLCVDFVNAFSAVDKDCFELTAAQMKAVEKVLENDLKA